MDWFALDKLSNLKDHVTLLWRIMYLLTASSQLDKRTYLKGQKYHVTLFEVSCMFASFEQILSLNFLWLFFGGAQQKHARVCTFPEACAPTQCGPHTDTSLDTSMHAHAQACPHTSMCAHTQKQAHALAWISCNWMGGTVVVHIDMDYLKKS